MAVVSYSRKLMEVSSRNSFCWIAAGKAMKMGICTH